VSGGGRAFALATPGADGQVQTLVQLIDAIATGRGPRQPRASNRPRWRSGNAQLLIEDDYDAGVMQELERAATTSFASRRGTTATFGSPVSSGIDEQGTPFAASDSPAAPGQRPADRSRVADRARSRVRPRRRGRRLRR